jgi:hypothetical protein
MNTQGRSQGIISIFCIFFKKPLSLKSWCQINLPAMPKVSENHVFNKPALLYWVNLNLKGVNGHFCCTGQHSQIACKNACYWKLTVVIHCKVTIGKNKPPSTLKNCKICSEMADTWPWVKWTLISESCPNEKWTLE